jgi:GTP cyclohydrolase II
MFSKQDVKIHAEARLPTRWGDFRIFAFKNNIDLKEHVAVVRGDICGVERVYTRVHSECLTGDVFGSLKCDCREQLERALESISNLEAGLILYMRQEGRGIGLANKIAAYSLQDDGMDTVEANHHLGFDDDLREYQVAARMIELLGPESIVLLTNNPSKVAGLKVQGVNVSSRLPIVTVPNDHNRFYLKTKGTKSGHLLGLQ